MNDPLTPILGPWGQLGVIGSVVIVLGWAVYHLWHKLHAANQAHISEVKSCAAETRDMAIKQIEANNKLANALDGLETVVKTALDTMRK